VTHLLVRRRGRPQSETGMISKLYAVVGVVLVALVALKGFGALDSVVGFMGLFGGMLLGWSLQAPVSGFAAWLLINLTRPIRPGDRVQFPALGLTGDIVSISGMYTVLDQVGGSVGSEEAVGRNILVPNAMLFGQVLINYTVTQDASTMLDELVLRITYDSDWDAAERILLDAARAVTSEAIAETGVEPYIRSDLYDYGVYLRIRYHTRVKDRAQIAYEIQKRVFKAVHETPSVDLAIPYVYSYRAAFDRKSESDGNRGGPEPMLIGVADVHAEETHVKPQQLRALARNITERGLLQPIVVAPRPDSPGYTVLAGHARLAACRMLGWSTIPAIVQRPGPPG
jgi:small-conductance mechanosensitive channel